MNARSIRYYLGHILRWEAILMAPSLIVSLIYGEWDAAQAFLVTMGILLVVSTCLLYIRQKGSHALQAREGLLTVGLSWVLLSLFGALPFTLCGDIPNYVDAVFESVSGFTTTGASILSDVEALNHGMLFWRSFTHWVGGMGVLVFIMALVPKVSDRSIHILRAEMPGPVVGKLTPRSRDTASVLYKIYIAMTLAQILLLMLGGMPLFESLLHAFGTAGTGGFGVKADSIASYSPYLQWVIAIFMLLFGVNFNLYYLLLIKRFKAALQSSEVWYYFGIVFFSVAMIAANILPLCKSFAEAVRLSAFQVSSIITTTGYATADFNLWPQFSKSILLVLMLVGACAGSTGGGLKVSRAVMLVKMVGKELKHMLHPRSVNTVRFEGKNVDGSTLKSVSSYFAIYMLCIFSIYLILSFNGFDMETNMSAAFSCFNNIGPGLGAVGPSSSYAAYSGFSKFVLSVAMLMGRLEIFPILLTCSYSTWKKVNKAV